MKDQFVELVHKRLCEAPEEVVSKEPIFWLIYITYHEAHMHPLLYAKHLMLSYAKRFRR